jgi:hypothetical protein
VEQHEAKGKEERGVAVVPRSLLPDVPLVTADQAKEQWRAYSTLKAAILEDSDYQWFVEWSETDGGRLKVKRRGYRSRAEADVACKDRGGGAAVVGRMVKSACRKMAKFFGVEIPETDQGETKRTVEGKFIVSEERGAFYTHIEWLDAGSLAMIKASTTVFIRSASGRTWMGRGGAHRGEGFEDFAIGATSFTRAANRAILDLIGWGEESGEETRATEGLPGVDETPPSAQGEEDPPPTSTTEAPKTPPPAVQGKRVTRETLIAVVQTGAKHEPSWTVNQCIVQAKQLGIDWYNMTEEQAQRLIREWGSGT